MTAPGLWYVSFSSPTGFLGVCVIDVAMVGLDAIAKATSLGLDPAGADDVVAVLLAEADTLRVAPSDRHRLLTLAECERIFGVMTEVHTER